jgi:P63C domain
MEEKKRTESSTPEGLVDLTIAAKALGRLGGLKGGKARAAKLTPEQRSEIAKKGAQTRWANQKETRIREVLCGSEDQPLRIHGIEIPCYVLDDDTRVITHRGLQRSLGMAESGGAQRMVNLLQRLRDKGLDSKDLAARIENPIEFRFGKGGRTAFGYEATILADLCDVILAARKADILLKQQEHFAEHAEILVRGFARVGIIALVDEATGFQQLRARKALEEILEQFISKELVKWARMFGDDFYSELFRLRSWKYDPNSKKRPLYTAKLTIDLVYARLAPGVLQELQRLTPRDEKGRLKHKLFQRLTEDIGHPKLRERLVALTDIMKGYDDWDSFYRHVQRAYPKYNETPFLNLKYDPPSGEEEDREAE